MIRVCGWDVGIRHLAFCEGIIPAQQFSLEHLKITSCGYIDLQAEQQAVVHQWPLLDIDPETVVPDANTPILSCCKTSAKGKPCSGQPRWILNTPEDTLHVYCVRHQKDEKAPGDWWSLFVKDKNKKPKLGAPVKARHIAVDSSEEDADEEQLSLKITATCGICRQEFESVRQPFWVHRPIEHWNGSCVHPICFKCVRAPLPNGWEKWPRNTRNILVGGGEPEDKLLHGPGVTETDEIMQKLVRCLREKWPSGMDLVWIENQPALVNPRMKSLQMILYTHFQGILSDKGGSVRFVNPNQKWKTAVDLPDDSTYRVHKQDSVNRFVIWLRQFGDEYEDFLRFFEGQKKKDDMADAFWIVGANLSEWKVNRRFLSEPDTETT